MNGRDMREEFFDRVTDGLSRKDVLEGTVRGKVASAILTRRCELGLSQTKFARYMGVSRSEVSAWENGERDFAISELCELCERLSLVFDVVLTEEESYPAGG